MYPCSVIAILSLVFPRTKPLLYRICACIGPDVAEVAAFIPTRVLGSPPDMASVFSLIIAWIDADVETTVYKSIPMAIWVCVEALI